MNELHPDGGEKRHVQQSDADLKHDEAAKGECEAADEPPGLTSKQRRRKREQVA